MGDEIIKVLNELSNKFGIAVDWTSQNVLPYLQMITRKIVNYEIATSIVWMILGLIMCIVSVIVIKKLNKSFCDGTFFDEDVTIVCYIFFGCILVSGFIIIIFQTFDIVTCLTFPEKIVFEQVKQIYGTLK